MLCPGPGEGTSPAEVAQIVDHLFRRESGRLVAILARRFGWEHLQAAEDVVQDALLAAMKTWPFTGVPANPTAWILQVARNQAINQSRHRRMGRGKEPAIGLLLEDCLAAAVGEPPPRFEDEIRDSQLRAMLVCCHPDLPREQQVALTLKVLCGFGEREIAAAFLMGEAAIAKRLVRARRFLREARLSVDLPGRAELAPRVETVREVLYLLFSEGHKASHGDSLLREDLCAEAIRLGELLAGHFGGDRPATHALLALMYFNAARLPARMAADGGILRLADQRRELWDRDRIRRGVAHFAASGRGRDVTRFHLEAGIAACHALAPDDAGTDWSRILGLYDELMALAPSSIVALNRTVAVAKRHGPRSGLQALAALPGPERRALERYHLYYAVAAEFWREAGEPAHAAASLRRALALTTLRPERALLERRLAEAEGAAAPARR